MNSAVCLGVSLVLLITFIILLAISFSHVEYYEYGLVQRKSTGAVDTSAVYSNGRYVHGPDKTFLKYQADAHYEKYDGFGVFSAGGSNDSIGLSFQIDVDFTFFLIEDEIGALHQELAKSYRNIIVSRAKDAIKNEAIFISFMEYFQNRKEVEKRFRDAVQARWIDPPSLHCTLDQFHLGRIQIPESVAVKQLESKVQNERNDREKYLQQAQVERELTAVQVNSINLEKEKVLRTALAEASLERSKAKAEAAKIQAEAQINGTLMLVQNVGIITQDHVTSFSYIRTLRNRDNVNIDVSYLAPDNILRTRGA